MSNLSITTRCNKSCPYCFAGDSKIEKAGSGDMSRDCYLDALDFLRRSEINQVRLLGGEPSLHEDFTWMLEKAIEEGFKLLVFSNGLMAPATVNAMRKIGPKKLRVLLNTIHPLEDNKAGMQRQRRTMEQLGRIVMPGVNIYSRQQSLDYLLDYVSDFGLFPEIRIGIAHPLLAGRNSFLHTKSYDQVGLKIADLHQKAKERKVKLGLDCGFVPCMFPVNLFRSLEDILGNTGVCCNPILDLLPDGRFISCYPLNNMKQTALGDGITADLLKEDFRQALRFTEEIGIYSYCRRCPLFGDRCSGGCVAQKLRRFRRLAQLDTRDASVAAIAGPD